ncbi:glycosyltransferase [Pontibacter sp. G13]|uniref:glycosyltransferase n=1 Tax=Pontibacter sp. G13 TaxID=3074898 RepID=UPI00288B995D|nr:glycosyltransferase [Pontibacter sp. G13]WNJ21405.1 glycosyltransferase [Pontibacter sp. G13]
MAKGSQRILVAPLDWGLGHATRCIPIIEALQENGAEPLIAGAGNGLKILQGQFPDIPTLELPSYQIRYAKGRHLVPALMKQVPSILRTIKEEKALVDEWITKYNITGIISDNRYGVRSTRVPSVVICHQLAAKAPKRLAWGDPIVRRAHMYTLRHFDEVWVPDSQKVALSESMAHGNWVPSKVSYLGLLSRFFGKEMPADFETPELKGKTPNIVAVISGPEPQRSQLVEKIKQQALSAGVDIWMVLGQPKLKHVKQEGGVLLIPHLKTPDMHRLLGTAEIVISRSGYTSLMDYLAIGTKKNILVATPGQTEQEFLAERLHERKIALNILQKNFELTEALEEVEEFAGMSAIDEKLDLSQRLGNWLRQI